MVGRTPNEGKTSSCSGLPKVYWNYLPVLMNSSLVMTSATIFEDYSVLLQLLSDHRSLQREWNPILPS